MDGESALGEFLRARRRLTTLDQVGLEGFSFRRRTPGLRREEVAMLAGISIDYYTRLEQGRERHPSEQVLDALAAVFQLGEQAAEHLREIARPRNRRRRPAVSEDQVDPNVLRLMHGWDLVAAYVVNRRLDVLARNPVATALYEGLEHSDNLLRLALLNPAAREFYLDWEIDTNSKVAHLRAAAGADRNDSFVLELVEELSRESEDFREMWARHDVRGRTRAPVRFHHREAGDVLTTMVVFGIDGAPGQKLITFQTEPGSPSERALALLAGRSPEAYAATDWDAVPDLT